MGDRLQRRTGDRFGGESAARAIYGCDRYVVDSSGGRSACLIKSVHLSIGGVLQGGDLDAGSVNIHG